MLLALNSPDTSRILKLIDRGDLGKIEQALERYRSRLRNAFSGLTNPFRRRVLLKA